MDSESNVTSSFYLSLYKPLDSALRLAGVQCTVRKLLPFKSLFQEPTGTSANHNKVELEDFI